MPRQQEQENTAADRAEQGVTQTSSGFGKSRGSQNGRNKGWNFCQDTSWLSSLPGDRDPPGSTVLPGDPQSDEKWVFLLPTT